MDALRASKIIWAFEFKVLGFLYNQLGFELRLNFYLVTMTSHSKLGNRCPHVGAGGLTSGGMPEEEQFLALLGNDKK